MSICPKGKMSKSKRDKRKAQSWKIATPTLVAESIENPIAIIKHPNAIKNIFNK